MDLWVTIGVLVRRWYLTLPLLALVGLAAVQIGNGIEPTYSATATAQVYCPSEAADPNNPGETIVVNPFCADSTTNQLATRTAVHLNSRSTRRSVADQGLLGDYLVDDNDAPLLYVTAEGPNEDQAIDTLTATMALVETYVDGIQPDEVFKYTAEGIDVPIQADDVSSDKTRTQIIIIVAGLILTTVVVHLFDAGLVALRRRRADLADAGPVRPTEADPISTLDSARKVDGGATAWDEATRLLDDEAQRLVDDGEMASPVETESRWGR